MATSKVDQKHRIVIDRQTRAKTHIKAGDIVIIEPLDNHSFKVNVLDFTSEKLEDDPAQPKFLQTETAVGYRLVMNTITQAK